jgi:hypothetical protein
MKYFIDGDQVVVTRDDFVDLQESPAVFVPVDSPMGQEILSVKQLIDLPLGDLRELVERLNHAGKLVHTTLSKYERMKNDYRDN